MAHEQISSPEQVESELLSSIVDDGKTIAVRLQQVFGEVFYPMKFVNLPKGKIAYSNPGGKHPMSLRMHQVIDGQAAGVEVSLFFKALHGSEGQGLWLFEDEQNRSNISYSTGEGHTYYFISQHTDGSLTTVAGPNSPTVDPAKLQDYQNFVSELVGPLQDTLTVNTPH
jgi:hypothetical protein